LVQELSVVSQKFYYCILHCSVAFLPSNLHFLSTAASIQSAFITRFCSIM
jgi:hypothetical protein